MNKNIIGAILITLIVGGGAFFAGMKYAESKSSGRSYAANAGFGNTANMTPEQRQQRLQQVGGRRGTNGQGGGISSGEIIAKDDKSITVKINDGGSKIVFFSDTTKVGQYTDGKTDDLIIGKSVMVNGTANSDGSVTAQMIQIRPEILDQRSGQPIPATGD
jgi:hypothetical protein